MSCAGDARDRVAALWRRIEDAHYSYLEIDDSPEKLQQKRKLEGYITEYLSLVPHDCKFGLAETGKVFQRTINELEDYSAYRAGIGWAAIARYAGNLLAQPWRKEYKVIRLYSGFYKHEVEANLTGSDSLLQAMGYRPVGAGKLAMDGPICPDMAAALSRDAIIAQCECQIMSSIWEAVWGSGARVSWTEIARDRQTYVSDVNSAVGRLIGYVDDNEIYSNLPTPSEPHRRLVETGYTPCNCPETPIEDIPPVHPYMATHAPYPHMVYPHAEMPPMPCNAMPCEMPVPMIPYGVPYYYPLQPPYMIPTPVYTPIKHATNVPINGYVPQYRYPSVPTAQLIELDSDKEDRRRRHEKRSKSGYSDISTPSFPKSDTQPSLKAKEDGMGTYESWDYVFRNLSSKNQDDAKSGFSQSLERDSRTLDRLEKEERRKYQPTTLDLEDGLQALNLDRSYDEDMYRTAKVNESLMRLKQEQELKRARLKKQEKARKPEPIPNPTADGLVTTKVAPDKVKLLSKKDIKDRKEVIKQTNGVANDVKKVKKTVKQDDKPKRPLENGIHKAHSSKSIPSSSTQSYDLKAQLIVSLDEPDARIPNGDRDRTPNERPNVQPNDQPNRTEAEQKWQCGTCTYLNRNSLQACEMCGKSKKGPEIEPLTSGGRECPACTLVNRRHAKMCDACGTSLEHCPTYI